MKKLKTHIRDWLGIKDISKEERLQATSAELRKLAGEAALSLLGGMDVGEYADRWGLQPRPDGTRSIRQRLKELSRDTARNVATEVATKETAKALASRIDGEAFIDEIVHRISRKQLVQ